jgi:hypothetical protein
MSHQRHHFEAASLWTMVQSSYRSPSDMVMPLVVIVVALFPLDRTIVRVIQGILVLILLAIALRVATAHSRPSPSGLRFESLVGRHTATISEVRSGRLTGIGPSKRVFVLSLDRRSFLRQPLGVGSIETWRAILLEPSGEMSEAEFAALLEKGRKRPVMFAQLFDRILFLLRRRR